MSSDFVTLLGAETVGSAASLMSNAADRMQQAARDMEYAYSNHQRFMNDWLDRLGSLLEEQLPKEGKQVFDVRVVEDEEGEDRVDDSEGETLCPRCREESDG